MAKKSVEKELVELEKKYWKAIQSGDAEAASRLSADPCILAGAQGVSRISREQLEGMLKSATYELKSFDLEDVQCQMLTDDVAVLAYKVHEDLTVDGKPITLDAAESSTWVKRDGRWVCAVHTESIAGDSFGRDRRAAN